MTFEDIPKLLEEVLSRLALETISLLPKILACVVVIVLAFVVIKTINALLWRLLKFAKLDAIFNRFVGFALPFSLERLIVVLADVGVMVAAFYAMASLFLDPSFMQMINDGLYYTARVFSVVIIALLIFAIFSNLTAKIKVDPRFRMYTLMILILLVTAMLIDITALSSEVKSALVTGLSMGVGVTIGAFAIWFFFHEYLEVRVKSKIEEKQQVHER